MTAGAQVRRWYRDTSRVDRTTTLVAIAVLLSLVVASIAMRPPDEETDVVAGGFGTGPGAGTGGLAGGDALGEGGRPGTGTAGGAAAGGASAAGGAGGGAGGAVGGGPGGGGKSSVLAASDRGVAPTKIKIGFMLQNAGGLNSTGFSTSQRSDGPRYVEALAAWANRNGGVAGREVVPVFRFTDPTSVEDQAAACRAMIDDAKVFAVIDVAAMLDTAAIDCVANREKGDTPLIHSVMWSKAWQARSGGNDVSYQAAVDRISITWARDLAALRWFPEGATVGILGDNCPATEPVVRGVLAPALKERGAGRVVFGLHDCDIQSVVSQPANIATQFRLEGVTHVLITSNFVTAQLFIGATASQGWKPKYAASDWFLNTSDPTSANFDPDQFDGAVGIASLGTMLADSGKPPYPGWEPCSEAAVQAGLPPIKPDDNASEELLHLCDNFLLFKAAADRAAPNPTRALWRAAVQSLGWRTSAVFGRSQFGPGKFTGSDFVHTVRWQRGCRCWRSVSDFRPAAA